MERYIVTVGEVVVALQFTPETGRVVLGGNKRFRPDMRIIVQDAFGCGLFEPKCIQRNKVRYEFSIAEGAFIRGLEDIERLGYAVNPVKKHGRIMR